MKKFYLILIITLPSCGTEKTETEHYSYAVQELLKNDEGIFRGASIGMSHEEVKNLEAVKPEEEDPGFLYYELYLKDSGEVSISYVFSNDSLNEILVDILPASEKKASGLYSELKSYYEARFGQPEEIDGELTWIIDKKDRTKGKLSLSEESADYGYPKLSLYLHYDPTQ